MGRIQPGLLFALVVWFCAAGGSQRAESQVRIMPLGDSITAGAGDPAGGGYRTPLWNAFVRDAFYGIFVGSLTSGPPELGSRKHEGHSGWIIRQIFDNIQPWLAYHQPDIVLLMIGTNDCNGNIEFDSILDRLSGLIDRITDGLPTAALVVASVPTIRGDAEANARARYYSDSIPDLVSAKQRDGRPVQFVDMYYAGIELSDGLHPTPRGFQTMAGVWYPAIQALIN